MSKPTIIGIAGLKGSGKGEVASALKALVPGAVKLAFADPIKRICKEVFAFSDEQVNGALKEVPDERYSRPMPSEFYFQRWALEDGTLMVSLMRTCKDGAREIVRADGGGGRSYEEIESAVRGSEVGFLTPEKAMLWLDTEWGRACYPDVWIDLAMRRARILLREKPHTICEGEGCHTCRGTGQVSTPLVILPDCRFPNEADAIRREGGQVWRVTRPGTAPDGHASEVQDFPVDVTFANDGKLDDLRAAVADAWGRA